MEAETSIGRYRETEMSQNGGSKKGNARYRPQNPAPLVPPAPVFLTFADCVSRKCVFVTVSGKCVTSAWSARSHPHYVWLFAWLRVAG